MFRIPSVVLLAAALLLHASGRDAAAQTTRSTSASPAARDLRHPSARIVGQWRDQHGTTWFLGPHDEHEEGVLHVVRSNSVRTRWKYRILEESDDTHLVLFVMEPNNSTRELVLTVPRDGSTMTMVRRGVGAVTFAVADSLRYLGPKHRPDR